MFSESIEKLNNQYQYGLLSMITKGMMDPIENILNTYPESVQPLASHEYLGSEDLPWDVILQKLINLDISKAYHETVKQRLSPEYGPLQDLIYHMIHRNKKSSMNMILRDRHGGLHKIFYGHA